MIMHLLLFKPHFVPLFVNYLFILPTGHRGAELEGIASTDSKSYLLCWMGQRGGKGKSGRLAGARTHLLHAEQGSRSL